VTDGTAEYNASRYRLSVFYDLAKLAVNRLAFSQGHELEPPGATAVAITPGCLRSEMMLDNFGVTECTWRAALDPTRARSGQPVAPADFGLSESPRYIGRAIAALAADPTGPGGTRAPSHLVNSLVNTASLISMAHNRTSGGTSMRSAKRDSTQTSISTARSAAHHQHPPKPSTPAPISVGLSRYAL
jgi:NAD(P)-dependent dehydrogenase (short-subunit alcohol dehydrogenase family)